jgi:hypothetical protein
MQRYQRCRKEENIVSAIWLVIFFIFLFVCIYIGEFIESQPRWLEVTFIIAFFSILFTNLFFIFKTIRNRLRRYGLVCPNCRQVFSARRMIYILNKGCCANCGHHLLKTGKQ